MNACHHCGRPVEMSGPPGRAETCPACDADLHCCRNCRFYDPAAYNECRETQAERVLAKERSNFCDYFAWQNAAAGHADGGSGPENQGNPLDRLFKKV